MEGTHAACHLSRLLARMSNAAPACPSCGRPTPARGQTIEATGKTWKGLVALGVVIILVSFGACAAVPDRPLWIGIAALGIIVTVTAKIGAWWHHA